MTTLAQYIFSLYFPEEALDFTDNEHFLEFRDAQIIDSGISIEKLDAPYQITTPLKPESKGVTVGTINRRAHNILRKRLKGATQIHEVQRLLLEALHSCSLQLESANDSELVEDWGLQIQPLLEQKQPLEQYEVLVSILTKINTLSGKGSKTMENYLRSTKEVTSLESNDTSFKIPI